MKLKWIGVQVPWFETEAAPTCAHLILTAAFNELELWVKLGGLARISDIETAEARVADFELNQCYTWWKNVYPDYRVDEQKYLKRLIEQRQWLK